MALLGCGSPAGLLQLRQWNPVPRRRSRGRGNSLRWLPPSGRTARTAEAPVALDALPAGSGGGGGGDGRACVTRDCRPSSGAAIFSSPGPQAKKGPGSSRLPNQAQAPALTCNPPVYSGDNSEGTAAPEIPGGPAVSGART